MGGAGAARPAADALLPPTCPAAHLPAFPRCQPAPLLLLGLALNADAVLPPCFAHAAGAIYVSRGLKEHTNEYLKDLDLGYNEIKDEGACAIAQVRPSALLASLPVLLVWGSPRKALSVVWTSLQPGVYVGSRVHPGSTATIALQPHAWARIPPLTPAIRQERPGQPR